MSKTASTIEIIYDGVDVTSYVLPAETSFEVVSSGMPGQATITFRDPQRVLSFTSGKTLQMKVDGTLMWAGIVMTIGRKHFFPAVNSSILANVHDRKWVIGATDWNIWFDKRVLRDDTNFLRRLHEPGGPLGSMVVYLFDKYIDTIPGLTVALTADGGGIEQTDRHYPKGLFVGQGKLLRDQMEDLAQYGGALWYISPPKVLIFRTLSRADVPWEFTDYHPKPNGTRPSMGFRDGEYNEDGMQLITDALVWGGAERLAPGQSAQAGGTVFARYPDPPANDQELPGVDALAATTEHPAYPAQPAQLLTKETEAAAIQRQNTYGIWQRAEMRPGEQGYQDQFSVLGRAYTIVAGPTGTDTATMIEGGLNKPLEQMKLSWFAHDVPNGRHIQPGEIATFRLYAMGVDLTHPLCISLPMRRIVMTFPGLDAAGKGYVRMDGEFGISYTDSRYLWKHILKRRSRKVTVTANVTNNSTSAGYGDYGEFVPLEVPDGSRVTFSLPFPYQSATTSVYLNGLRQRINFDYSEVSPSAATFRFGIAPSTGDTIVVTCRVGSV